MIYGRVSHPPRLRTFLYRSHAHTTQNGRVAMFGFAIYTWEEFITQTPLIDIPGNELLLEPAYQVPYIQKWLDNQFSGSMGDLWI